MHGKGKRFAVAVTVLVAVLALAACGGDDESTGTTTAGGGASQESAQAIVDNAKAVPTFALEAPAIKAEDAKGKKIFAIPGASANPFAATIVSEMHKIADQLGIDFVDYANNGTPSAWAQGVEQAIAQKADVIVFAGGSDPALVMPQLKRAYAAGITAVTAHYYEAGKVPQEVQDLGVAHVMGPFNVAGRLLVDYAFADRGEDLYPLIVTSKEAAPSDGMVASMQEELAQVCPACKAEVLNVPIPDWATKMSSAVASKLGANPSLNYILPLYDSMSINVAAGVQSAGKAGDAPIASFNGTPAILKMIQDGDLVVAVAGESLSWIAYATMDQSLRLMLGEDPIPDGENNTMLPLRIFDDLNVDEAGTPPDSAQGYGDAHVAGYETLWGLD